MQNRIPPAPLVLGLAGLLPPLAGALAVCLNLGSRGDVVHEAVLIYAALIASFLGGSWWGFVSRAEQPSWLLMAVSVLPSLLAWAMLLTMTSLDAGFGLAALILLSLAVDWRLQQVGLAPPWWLRLRVPLSLTLAVSLLFVTFCR